MSGHPQGFSAQSGGAQAQRPGLPDFRSPTNGAAVPHRNGQGPVPVPSGPPGLAPNEHRRSTGGAPPGMGTGLGFSRSPPSTKNTSHVPCKFFRAGNCQAGNACPFSHSTDLTIDVQPCKYFAKGNCKFGQKCALAHVLPNGRVVNRPPFGPGGGGGGAQYNGAAPPGQVAQYPDQMMQSAMAGQVGALSPQRQASLMHNQNMGSDSYLYPGQKQSDNMSGTEGFGQSLFGIGYGTSPSDGLMGRSPTNWAQPMPDLDPQGNAGYAKFGPFAQSVPSTFGWGPVSSTSTTSSTTKSTAFGNLDYLARKEAAQAAESNTLGSSPPIGSEVMAARNAMNSYTRRSRPQMISSSVGARPSIRNSSDGEAVEDSDEYGEAFLPETLSDLLTPQEKLRRFSRTEEDHAASTRQSLSGFGSPADSKVGSPSNASPSSRFGALFAKKRWEEANNANSDSAVGSPFGHVGSPLRNSSLHPETSPRIRPMSRPRSRDHSPFGSMTNPPAARSSALSHQLNSLHLQDAPTSNSTLYSSAIRNVSGASTASVGTSSSLGAGGRMSGRIDEEREQENEHEEGVFAMDEEELKERERKKRLSGGTPTTGTGTPEIAESSGRVSPVEAGEEKKNGGGGDV